jgi:hypothetical protein
MWDELIVWVENADWIPKELWITLDFGRYCYVPLLVHAIDNASV